MTFVAIDRLVHRATIFELNVESYRRRAAVESKRRRGREASQAKPVNTPINPSVDVLPTPDQEPEKHSENTQSLAFKSAPTMAIATTTSFRASS